MIDLMMLAVMMICIIIIIIINNIIMNINIKKGKDEYAVQVYKEGMLTMVNMKVMKGNDVVDTMKDNLFSSCSIVSMIEHKNSQAWLS